MPVNQAAIALGGAGAKSAPHTCCAGMHDQSAASRGIDKRCCASCSNHQRVHFSRPARGIVNQLIREDWPISVRLPLFPLAFHRSLSIGRKGGAERRADFLPMWAGQNVSGCKEVPAAQLTQALGS